MASLGDFVAIFAGLLLCGTLLFVVVEDLQAVDAFYLTGVTLGTVGFGDLKPTTQAGKVAAVLLALCGLGLFADAQAAIGELRRNSWTKHSSWAAQALPLGPLTLPVVLAALNVLAFTSAMRFIEGLEWDAAAYFAFVTLTSIGYGDITPKTNVGKIATVFFVCYSSTMLTLAITSIAQIIRSAGRLLKGGLVDRLILWGIIASERAVTMVVGGTDSKWPLREDSIRAVQMWNDVYREGKRHPTRRYYRYCMVGYGRSWHRICSSRGGAF